MTKADLIISIATVALYGGYLFAVLHVAKTKNNNKNKNSEDSNGN